MVTRITIGQTNTLSADLGAPKVPPTAHTVEHFAEKAKEAYEQFHKLLAMANEKPDIAAEVLIDLCIPEATYSVRNMSNTRRTYSIGRITITEEDQP